MRRLLLLASLGVLALFPSINTASRESDTARITTYAAQFDLAADGDLASTETIDVEMPTGKRGIFKIFDTADPRRNVDHPVSGIAVQRDVTDEPFTVVDSAKGAKSIRIGDAGVYLDPGNHRYVISSSTVDVLERGSGELDGQTVWWWDVVGAGWQMPMGAVEVQATLPAEPTSAECVMADTTPCTVKVEGATLRVNTESLDPFTPVTVRVAFDPADVPLPPADHSGLITLILSIVAALLGIGLGFLARRAVHEDPPGFPVLFEPPFMVPPALGVRVLDERDSPNALQATLFDLAERGTLRLQGDDSSWTIELIEDPSATALHPIESVLLTSLRLYSPGDVFVVEKSIDSGERLSTATSAIGTATTGTAREYLANSGVGSLARVMAALATVLVVAAAAMKVFWALQVPWPIVALAAGYALVTAGAVSGAGASTRRTPEGRDLWSRTGGFARFLATDSSEARFDAAAHLDWYPRYLAWAVALGVADKWAERYEAQGVSIPEVPWLLWAGTGRFSANSMSSMTSSFDSMISNASSAYAASQASSSSGGGGGFSGGSGGGGGGGGSW